MLNVHPTTEASDAMAQIEAAVRQDTGKKRMPMVWVPATIFVGLLIASAYLGGRILTGHSHASAAAHVVAPARTSAAAGTAVVVLEKPAVLQSPAEAVPQPKAEAPALVSDQPLSTIDPQAGERYIQVAALNLEAAKRYISQLQQAKLEPHLAPGPKPELLRILIGPFADTESLSSKKSDLDRAGIDNFVRKY